MNDTHANLVADLKRVVDEFAGNAPAELKPIVDMTLVAVGIIERQAEMIEQRDAKIAADHNLLVGALHLGCFDDETASHLRKTGEQVLAAYDEVVSTATAVAAFAGTFEHAPGWPEFTPLLRSQAAALERPRRGLG